MDLSKLHNQLIKHEGISLKPYTDTVGKITIGVGHNLTDNGITQAQAMSILDDDLDVTIKFLMDHCPWWSKLDDVRQRAIADLTFDIRAKLLDFHFMIAAIETQDWSRVSKELLDSTFAHQAPNRARDLAHQLLTGTD